MDRFYRCAAYAFLVAVPIYALWGHGKRWEFGRYMMPRSLVAPDGFHYQNGQEIDPLTLAAVRADREEESMLALASVVAILLALLAVELRNFQRTLARDGAMRAELSQYGCLRDPIGWQRRMAEDRSRKWRLW